MAKLLSTKSTRLPSKGNPGDVFFVTDQKAFYIAIGDGTLINLADLLSGAVPHVRAVGPQGEAGPRGEKGDAGPQGPRGEKGTAGNDGQQGPVGPKGADGLPGPAGKDGKDGKDGAPGPQGPQGLRGELGIMGPRGPMGETHYVYVGPAEVEAAHKEILKNRARVLAVLIDKLQTLGSHPAARLAAMHLEDVKRALES